jgi:hypothetical protein
MPASGFRHSLRMAQRLQPPSGRPDSGPFALPQGGSRGACDTRSARQLMEPACASRAALAMLQTSSRNPSLWPTSTSAGRP